MCRYLQVGAMIPFFLYFRIQRKTVEGKHGWVSLKQSKKKLFKMFLEFVCDFKDRHFLVKTVSEKAFDYVLEEAVVVDEDGYMLYEEDKESYAKLCKFVDDFYPVQWVTREGKDFLGDDDEPVYEARAISTKALLECHSYMNCVALLGICSCLFPFSMASHILLMY